MKFLSSSNLDSAFAALERFAVQGERCPQNETHGITSGLVSALAREGRLRVEISGHNYRRVVLLTGEYQGQATAPDPTGAHVWRIVDASGTRVNGKLSISRAGRQKPSAPRPLSTAELKR